MLSNTNTSSDVRKLKATWVKIAGVVLVGVGLAWAIDIPLVWDGVEGPPSGSGNIECFQYEGSIVDLCTFEGGTDGGLINPENGGLIEGTASGMRFPAPWRTLLTGSFANNPSEPTIAFWTVGDFAEVTFDTEVASVSFYYSAYLDVVLEAFDANGSLVATSTGAGNYVVGEGYVVWDQLSVTLSQNLITRVRITSYPQATLIDDFQTVIKPEVIITDEGNTQTALITFEGMMAETEIGLVEEAGVDFMGWNARMQDGYADPPTYPTVAFFTTDPGVVTFDPPVSKVIFYYASLENITFSVNGQVHKVLPGNPDWSNTYPLCNWDLVTVDLGENVITEISFQGYTGGRNYIDNFAVTRLLPPETPEEMLAVTASFIVDEVDAGNIEAELEQSLLAKVNAALSALARGNPNDAKVAMNDLKALINQVEAQTDNKIDPITAQAIIDQANAIIAELCG